MATSIARSSQLRAAAGVRSAAVPRPLALRNTFRVRATEDERSNSTSTKTVDRQETERKRQAGEEKVPSNPITDAIGSTGKPVKEFTVFNPVTEAINGRAAMVGIFAAIVSELITSQPVWTQVTGRFGGGELIERPTGIAFLGFGAVVVFATLASVIPLQVNKENAPDRETGPWTAKAELWNGRAAQIGFLALVIIEAIKGSALF